MANNLVKFVLHTPKPALWQFSASYNDENGDQQKLVTGTNNSTGEEYLAKIKFHPGKRMITMPANKKDIHGKSFVDFLENSPYCRGSKTCEGEGSFYLYDPIRDAKVSNDEAKLRLRAEFAAMELTGDKLQQMAAYFGVFNADVEVQRSTVMENARLRFREFNEKLGTPEVSNTAIFNSARNAGIIVQRGFLFVATLAGKQTTLGKSEESAIASITTDSELRGSIETHIKEAKK